MPKVKHFKNSLKSAPTPHDANGHSLWSISPSKPSIGPSTSIQSPLHDVLNPSRIDEVQQVQAPTQPSNSSAVSEFVPHWREQTIGIRLKYLTGLWIFNYFSLINE